MTSCELKICYLTQNHNGDISTLFKGHCQTNLVTCKRALTMTLKYSRNITIVICVLFYSNNSHLGVLFFHIHFLKVSAGKGFCISDAQVQACQQTNKYNSPTLDYHLQ